MFPGKKHKIYHCIYSAEDPEAYLGYFQTSMIEIFGKLNGINYFCLKAPR